MGREHRQFLTSPVPDGLDAGGAERYAVSLEPITAAQRRYRGSCREGIFAGGGKRKRSR